MADTNEIPSQPTLTREKRLEKEQDDDRVEADRRITVQWYCGKRSGRLPVWKHDTYGKARQEIARIMGIDPPAALNIRKWGTRTIIAPNDPIEEEVEIELVSSGLSDHESSSGCTVT